MLPLAAIAAEAKELKRVKQEIEALAAVFRHLQVVNRTVIQCLGLAAIVAGEMVAIPFQRRVKRLAVGQVTAAHKAPLLQLTQIAIHRG